MIHASNGVEHMRLKKIEGFTLIETLVAMTMFSVAVLGLAIGTVTLTRTNADSHLRTTAINVAQARIEELRAMNAATLTTLAAACVSISSTGCNDTFYASGTTYDRRWWFTTNSPVVGVNRIDVRVNWADHQNRSLTFGAAVPQ
jgi:prepilin-type N-terminal cleavage/methylation domain-containing protein